MGKAWVARTEAMLGAEAMDRLAAARVAVVGLGGVGSAAAEALCRAGVGHLLLVDRDCVDDTNRNRQMIATVETVGMPKQAVACRRLLSINPEGDFTGSSVFVLPETMEFLFEYQPDIILDAIDTVTAKLALARRAARDGVWIVSSMGMGGRVNPTLLRCGTLADTAGCGCALARVMRHELRKDQLCSLPVVYSLEAPCRAMVRSEVSGRHPPASSPFVPPTAGFALAFMVTQHLLGWDQI